VLRPISATNANGILSGAAGWAIHFPLSSAPPQAHDCGIATGTDPILSTQETRRHLEESARVKQPFSDPLVQRIALLAEKSTAALRAGYFR
jgi:hypothetical protein